MGELYDDTCTVLSIPRICIHTSHLLVLYYVFVVFNIRVVVIVCEPHFLGSIGVTIDRRRDVILA